MERQIIARYTDKLKEELIASVGCAKPAAIALAAAYRAEAQMQAPAFVAQEQKRAIAAAIKKGICETYHPRTEHGLHIVIDSGGENHKFQIEVCGSHENVIYLPRGENAAKRAVVKIARGDMRDTNIQTTGVMPEDKQ